MELIKKICKSYAEIVFPTTCMCCGTSTSSEERFICSFCRTQRFENAANSSTDILPETVRFVHTMWYFDKGGYLQDLLHQLKYHYMRGAGIELGYLLGKNFLQANSEHQLDAIYQLKPLLVPVPLHPAKKKKRGYNQARSVAEGVSDATGWELIEAGIVGRAKKTKTQTGLTMKQRAENLRNAFYIESTDSLKNRLTVIVDDVFTTGATTFELAGTFQNTYNSLPAGILTVARA